MLQHPHMLPLPCIAPHRFFPQGDRRDHRPWCLCAGHAAKPAMLLLLIGTLTAPVLATCALKMCAASCTTQAWGCPTVLPRRLLPVLLTQTGPGGVSASTTGVCCTCCRGCWGKGAANVHLSTLAWACSACLHHTHLCVPCLHVLASHSIPTPARLHSASLHSASHVFRVE